MTQVPDTLTTHKLSNGQEIWLNIFTGEVLPENHGVWLRRTADGKEKQIYPESLGLSAREGHVVTVLGGSISDSETGFDFAVRNHTTAEVHCNILESLSVERLNTWKLKLKGTSTLLLSMLLPGVIGALVGLSNGRGAEDKLGYAAVFGFFGVVVGMLAGAPLVNSLILPKRLVALTDEINELARTRLLQA